LPLRCFGRCPHARPAAGGGTRALNAARRPRTQRLLGRVALETELGAFLGDTRIRLLEGIERYGSITQAAKQVPLSYKAAWDAVNDMNNLADEALVERSVGGLHGGGTRLTEYGRRMIAFYRALEEDYQVVVDRLAQRLGDAGAVDVGKYRGLMRRLAMKTSARNQFVGPICALREGAVNFEVCLRIDERDEIAAIITRESAERLGLAIGKEMHAFIKASSVILMTGEPLRTSARNHLDGTVRCVHEGAVNDEVELSLPGGRTVVAIVTHESIARLGVVEGGKARALFKASDVILATFD
jgi:molybdate transport system regulatory protein